jgi:arylsulfatase
MPEKPNIIFIFSDQHRGDTMGAAGNKAVITPNLDRIAAEGAHFTRCSTNSPLCMPARASMMTGLHVSQHGVWNNDLMADPKGQSHVRNIREAGYHTALIGKTHLWIHGGRRKGTFEANILV